MSIPAVEESWARIDAWLTRHAPLTHATLRPPAAQADIEAAERTLGVAFHPGPRHGQVGRSFDEDMLSYAHWPSLRHVLADFADALERARPFFGRIPLAVEGKLLWEEERTVPADPVSPLTHATTLTEPESEPPAPRRPVFAYPEGDSPPQAPAAQGSQRLFFIRTGRPRPEPLPDQPDVAFAEGLTPAEMLRRLGAIPATVRPRDRRQAQRAVESPWAAHRPLVRAGTAGGWAYATIEGGAAQFARPGVLRALSAGTRVVVLTRQGPEVALAFAEDGVPCPAEDTRRVMSPREGNHAGGPWARRAGVDLWPGSTAAYTDFLAVLEEEFGIAYDPDEEGPTELNSALVLPLLDDLPEREPEACVRDFDLAGLVERTPPRRLRTAVAAQLARLAVETHLDAHPEVTEALDRIRHGLPVDCDQDDPLAVRMRTLVAEVHATRTMLYGGDSGPVSEDDLTAWVARSDAADALRAFLRLPLPVAAQAVLQRRISLHWRDELAADLRGT
ncbi:SMI1/KNR4 family protein [Streptomyces sp. LARHCF252]